jgi:cytochrome P450
LLISIYNNEYLDMQLKQAPRPEANPIFGSTLEIIKDPLGFLRNNEKEFPGISGMRVTLWNVLHLTDPDYIKHVLQTNPKNYKKGRIYREVKLVLGNGLLTNEGESWFKQRRLEQPAFYKERLAGFTSIMAESCREMLDKWKAENINRLDIHKGLTNLTLNIVCRTMFSQDVKDYTNSIGESLAYVIEFTYYRNYHPVKIPLWVPVPSNVKFLKHRKNLNDLIFSIINERKTRADKYNDLLQMLIDAKDADTGETMSDQQVVDEVMTIFIAGLETTANALTFAIYLLAEHPEAEQTLNKEISDVLSNGQPWFERLRSLNYTQMVINEAMRLYPPAYVITREALNDDQIGEYKVRKGDEIMISIFVMHSSNRFWNDPEIFDPSRFEPEKDKNRHKFVYFPFGGGPRICIGNNFAMMEMQILLSMIFNEFRFKKVKEHKVELEPLITLRPRNGMWMEIEQR